MPALAGSVAPMFSPSGMTPRRMPSMKNIRPSTTAMSPAVMPAASRDALAQHQQLEGEQESGDGKQRLELLHEPGAEVGRDDRPDELGCDLDVVFDVYVRGPVLCHAVPLGCRKSGDASRGPDAVLRRDGVSLTFGARGRRAPDQRVPAGGPRSRRRGHRHGAPGPPAGRGHDSRQRSPLRSRAEPAPSGVGTLRAEGAKAAGAASSARGSSTGGCLSTASRGELAADGIAADGVGLRIAARSSGSAAWITDMTRLRERPIIAPSPRGLLCSASESAP